MSNFNTSTSDSFSRMQKKAQTKALKSQFFQNQFSTEEQKTLNQALNFLSKGYSEQKTCLNYDEAKFLCYFFFSVFEISRRDFQTVDKDLIQLYHDVFEIKEVRFCYDIIINIMEHQSSLKQRSLNQFSVSDISNGLTFKQIVQVKKSWTVFDEEEQGFINGSDAELPVFHLLASYGYNENHPNINQIKELIEDWKLKTSFYLFFNEFACLICDINARFPLPKRSSSKQSCSCNIF